MEPLAVVSGRVVRGKRIGRSLGVPTANLPYPDASTRPLNGVYVARVVFPEEGGREEEAVLSQGFHPTFPEGEPTVEVFLLNASEDLYGRYLRIEYLHYIRPERRFASRELMTERMREDIRFARAWFDAQQGG